MGSLHKILCAGIGVICAANLFHMASIATPRWKEKRIYGNEAKFQHREDGELLRFYGLFEYCTPEDESEDECTDYTFDRVRMKYQVVQTLAYLAMVCGLIGVGSAIVLQLIIFISKTPVTNVTVIVTTAISTTLCLAAFGFDFAIVSIYGDRFMKKDTNFGYSFFLCLLSIALFITGTSLITYASKTINTSNGDGARGNTEGSVQFSVNGEKDGAGPSLEIRDGPADGLNGY